MAPMPSSEPIATLDAEQRDILIDVARRSITHGLDHGRPLTIDPTIYEPKLQRRQASFVTLHLGKQLRGCIGHLEALRPLVADVADNAYAAAFRDPRFSPLDKAEWPQVSLSLSVLGTPQPMSFSDEADLIRQLRPGEDGLILEDGAKRGTFLPSVWETLGNPAIFLRELKRKAGLDADHWTNTLKISRYHTESFGESIPG